MHAPLIVGIGGTARTGSFSELLLRAALTEAARLGARTQIFAGPQLALPIYDPSSADRPPYARDMLDALRVCDGVILASPAYHGSVSGLVKNALDHIEELRNDIRPYLDGRAVGCIACASGWQAPGAVLATLRTIVHSLRGWPTPFGIVANALNEVFGDDGVCIDAALATQMQIMADQIVTFAHTYGPRARAQHAASAHQGALASAMVDVWL